MPMKKGSGNLDFGASDDEPDETDEWSESPPEPTGTDDRDRSPSRLSQSEQTAVTDDEPDADTDEDNHQFPYFVRRSNVGDERDERIEVHLRKSVHHREAEFCNQLAKVLGTDEVSKTDAREFALKYAFEHPEDVAELMREDGFGLVD